MGNTHENCEYSISNKEKFMNQFENELFGSETNHATGENSEIPNMNEPAIINEYRLQKKRKRQKHSKEASDNIKKKILVHFLNFVVILINLIIRETLEDEYDSETMEFFEFNSKFKKQSSKKQFELLKTCSISNFLNKDENISDKKAPKHNQNAFNLIIEKNCKLKNIFDISCFEFFSYFYYKSSQIDLSQYGICKVIDLRNLRCFYEDKVKNNYLCDDKYITKMEKIIKKFFFKNYFFLKKSN